MSAAPIRAEARKRRPHLTIGCAAASLALVPLGAGAVVMLAALAAGFATWAFGARAAFMASALVMACALAGTARLVAIDRPARAAPPGAAIDATATLLERPRAGRFGSSAPMQIDSGSARGLRVLARNRDSGWDAEPGMRFRIRGLVLSPDRGSAGAAQRAFAASLPARRDPGIFSEANAGAVGTPGFGPLPATAAAADDFDYAAFLRSRGIGRELRLEQLAAIGRRGGLEGIIDSIRRRAEAGISRGLSRDRAALARGMVLGEDGDVAPSTRDDFRRTGLAHLLAASGQNIALLCALVLPLLMLAGASQRVRVAVLLPAIALYVALAGSGASIMRAGIMAAAALVAIVAGRASSAIYALLLAAAVTLAINPRAGGDPGWQLSFAAVLGMLVLGPALARPLRRLPRPLAEALGATLAATVATAPLIAHSFGTVSAVTVPANLAVFPAVAPVMWIGMAAAAVEQASILGPLGSAAARALEALAAPLAAAAVGWVAHVAGWFSERPWAQSHVHVSTLGAALAYLAGAGALVAARGMRLPHRLALPPAAAADWLRALTPASRRALAAPVIALMLGAVARAADAPRPPRHLTVDFIDVGQGDATLIRDPGGAAVLFDGGVPEARVDRTLARLGVRKLTVVVATHQSRDHHGGLSQVVERFPVGLFLDGRYGVNDPSFIALEHEVDRRRIPRRPTRAGQVVRAGGMTIRILWPPPRGSALPPADPNTRATVAIVSEAGFDLLLSADAEAPVLLPLGLPPVDAMKVPHHGSAETGLPQLLGRLRPRVAAIETGRGNAYGHPRPSTLRALGVVPRVFRTDRDGTIELTVSGSRIAIRTHR